MFASALENHVRKQFFGKLDVFLCPEALHTVTCSDTFLNIPLLPLCKIVFPDECMNDILEDSETIGIFAFSPTGKKMNNIKNVL